MLDYNIPIKTSVVKYYDNKFFCLTKINLINKLKNPQIVKLISQSFPIGIINKIQPYQPKKQKMNFNCKRIYIAGFNL